MKTQNSFVKKTTTAFLVSALAAGSLFFSVNSVAANACKGLSNTACTNSDSCRWVNGYERKDGRKVKSFCRSYSSKKKVSKAKKVKQKTNNKVSTKKVTSKSS